MSYWGLYSGFTYQFRNCIPGAGLTQSIKKQSAETDESSE